MIFKNSLNSNDSGRLSGLIPKSINWFEFIIFLQEVDIFFLRLENTSFVNSWSLFAYAEFIFL